MGKTKKEQQRKDEEKILQELQKNAKENINIISKRSGFTRQKAWRIIKQLEAKHQIWGYTAINDEEKLGLKHFIYLAKRTSNKIDETIVDAVISRKLEESAAKLGVIVESSMYVHGEYDWMLTAIAEDIVHAKMFSDLLLQQYPRTFESITIMQTLLFIKRQHILNPDKAKLKGML